MRHWLRVFKKWAKAVFGGLINSLWNLLLTWLTSSSTNQSPLINPLWNVLLAWLAYSSTSQLAPVNLLWNLLLTWLTYSSTTQLAPVNLLWNLILTWLTSSSTNQLDLINSLRSLLFTPTARCSQCWFRGLVVHIACLFLKTRSIAGPVLISLDCWAYCLSYS